MIHQNTMSKTLKYAKRNLNFHSASILLFYTKYPALRYCLFLALWSVRVTVALV